MGIEPGSQQQIPTLLPLEQACFCVILWKTSSIKDQISHAIMEKDMNVIHNPFISSLKSHLLFETQSKLPDFTPYNHRDSIFIIPINMIHCYFENHITKITEHLAPKLIFVSMPVKTINHSSQFTRSFINKLTQSTIHSAFPNLFKFIQIT